LKTKIKNLKIFIIPAHKSTYVEEAVYNFVVFRIKRAGCSNYRGAAFRLRPKGKEKGKRQNSNG